MLDGQERAPHGAPGLERRPPVGIARERETNGGDAVFRQFGCCNSREHRTGAGSDSIRARTVSQSSPPRQGAWKRSLRLIAILLAIWFTASLGLGVLLAEPLNRIWIGGFPLGFWFAQQGAILIFLVLLLVNAIAMDRIERDAGRSEDTEDPS